MRPFLLRFADGTYIHSGHFMVFLGGLVAILLVAIETKRIGERPEKIYGLLVLLMISAVYGAHVFYWIDFRGKYNYGPLDLLIFWKGGMALYGGAILAFMTYVIYTRWQGLDFWSTGDLLTPPTALFVFLARVGCFLAGCCWGRYCGPDFPLAVEFRDSYTVAPTYLPLYPTQPLFAATALMVFVILWARRRHKRFDGEIALVGLSLFCLTSFLIEFLRGDTRILYELPGITLSQNQIIAAAVFLVASGLYLHRRKKRKT